MFDDLQDLFDHSNAFGPNVAHKPAKAISASPFDRLHPEDRNALASPETLRSPFVRRWLNIPDPAPETLNARQASPPGATAAGDPDRYEVLAGWQVPDDWDLKDLGRAALDNATKAGSPDGARPAAPPLAAAAGVDAQGPDGGRSAAGQVRAAKTIRARAAQTHPARPKKPANDKTAGKGAGSLGVSAPAPTPAPTIPARGRALGEPEDLVDGPAAGLPAALWREIGGSLLDARDRIKRTSIDLEGRHGDDAAAHDAGVIATAQSADPKLPGHTERATVNSALLAGTKYRKSRAEKAPETQRAKTVASFRERYRTFRREAAHARDKAAQARDDGDDPAASRHTLDAEKFHEAAKAVLADARNTGIDPQQFAIESAGSSGGRGADVEPSEARARPAGATNGAERKRPQGVAAHPIARAVQTRKIRVEREMHAGLGDIEYEADRRERQQAADAAFRAGGRPDPDRTGRMLRGIDIAAEHGAFPRRIRPDLVRLFGYGTRTVSDPRLAHRYLAVLDRLAQLRERRPAIFDTLPPRLRTAVAVHRHIAGKLGGVDPGDRSAATLEALRRRSDLIERTVVDLHNPDGLKTLGLVADWLPVIGEFKSGVEALIALRNYIAARERGDSKAAGKYREEAAWGLVGLVPLLGYSRKGRKLLRQLAAPVAKLSVKAGDAFARKIEEAVARRRPKRGNQRTSRKTTETLRAGSAGGSSAKDGRPGARWRSCGTTGKIRSGKTSNSTTCSRTAWPG